MCNYAKIEMANNILYRIPGNFHENGNFNNFANDPRGQHKRCSIAIFRKF